MARTWKERLSADLDETVRKNERLLRDNRKRPPKTQQQNVKVVRSIRYWLVA